MQTGDAVPVPPPATEPTAAAATAEPAALEELDMDPRVMRAADFLTREVAAAAAGNPPPTDSPAPSLAALLLSCGESWRTAGRESDALVAFTAAFMEAEREEGQLPPAERRTVAVAAACVGASLLTADAADAAVGYVRLAHTLQAARTGTYGNETLAAAGELAAALVQADRADDALAVIDTLAAGSCAAGADDAVVDARGNLANMLHLHGHLEAAVAAQRRVAAHWLPRADAGSIGAGRKAAAALANLGLALADVGGEGGMAEAEAVTRRAVLLRERCDGPRAVPTGTTLMHLGALLLARFARDEARPILTRAADILAAAGDDAAPAVTALLARCDGSGGCSGSESAPPVPTGSQNTT